MKMMTMKAMILLGGMSFLGYMYLKKHPESINMMKDMIKTTSRNVYNMMEEE